MQGTDRPCGVLQRRCGRGRRRVRGTRFRRVHRRVFTRVPLRTETGTAAAERLLRVPVVDRTEAGRVVEDRVADVPALVQATGVATNRV